QPSKSCRCPLHEDRSASFSITADGALWNCFAGCGGGDAVDFYQHASGLPHAEACRAFIKLAGGSPMPTAPRPPRPKPADAEGEQAQKRKTWPPFESPLTGDDDTAHRAIVPLAKLRHVSVEGVTLMAARGLLWFGAWKDSPAWIVTDGERVNAQARRMDGQPWPGIKAKAQTLPGSRAAWPVGARESLPLPFVLLVEGGPDLLAAHHWIHAHQREVDVAAVAMLGASNSIHADALPLFAGKRIRIMAHTDEAGHAAAIRWKAQLDSVGARVDAADFAGLLMADGTPAKDLNDLTRLRPEDQPQLEDLIPNNENAQP
ncbi:MAG: hypothetical protein EB034_18050, partial [Verrucomicrobia bacterium]|nr:hypothetical protein [Verrucomicrobiota bacterium]